MVVKDHSMPDIQHFIALLKSDDPAKRYNACAGLIALRQPLPPEAMAALQSLTNDSNPNVAEIAQRVLALDTHEKKWGVRVADMRMTLFWIAFGVMISTVALGAILGNIKSVSQRIVMAYHCPEALHVTEELGPMVVGLDQQPIGQELRGAICTFADGSTKELSANEYMITSMVGALGLGAMMSVLILFVFAAIYLLWKKKAL